MIHMRQNTFNTYWFWLFASISSPPELRRTSSKTWSFLICCSWLSRARMRASEVRRLLAASRACSVLEQAASSFPAPSRICTSLSIFLSTSSSCHRMYFHYLCCQLIRGYLVEECAVQTFGMWKEKHISRCTILLIHLLALTLSGTQPATKTITLTLLLARQLNCQPSKLLLVSWQPVISVTTATFFSL